MTADQFASIAKLRAARRVWDRVGELCGLDPATAVQRQHAVTSRAMLTQRDPWVNLLRATLGLLRGGDGRRRCDHGGAVRLGHRPAG